LLPLGDRVRVAGSAEITGFDPKPVVARCDAIVANAGKTAPSLKAAFCKDQPTYCTGLRPVTPGGTPLIGRTRIKGLWINCGHGHLGWTMACGSGQVLADLMEGRDPGIPLLEPQGYSRADEAHFALAALFPLQIIGVKNSTPDHREPRPGEQ
jgi:D-amino-acid dehydrogenase